MQLILDIRHHAGDHRIQGRYDGVYPVFVVFEELIPA